MLPFLLRALPFLLLALVELRLHDLPLLRLEAFFLLLPLAFLLFEQDDLLWFEPEFLEPEFLEPDFLERDFLEPEFFEPEFFEPEFLEPEFCEPEFCEPEFCEPDWAGHGLASGLPGGPVWTWFLSPQPLPGRVPYCAEPGLAGVGVGVGWALWEFWSGGLNSPARANEPPAPKPTSATRVPIVAARALM